MVRLCEKKQSELLTNNGVWSNGAGVVEPLLEPDRRVGKVFQKEVMKDRLEPIHHILKDRTPPLCRWSLNINVKKTSK